MRQIHKMEIGTYPGCCLYLPYNTLKILKVGLQSNSWGGSVNVWYEVDPSVNSHIRVMCFGTGQELDPQLTYIDTVIMPDGYVWHYYRS